MSESSDKLEPAEAAALLKAIEILWNAMPDEAKEQVRQDHPDVADAAENIANMVQKEEQGDAQDKGQDQQADE